MLPFIKILGLEIASYGTLIVLGTSAGVYIAVLRSKILRLNRSDVLYACLYALIGAIIGAKFLYILTVLQNIIGYFKSVALSVGDLISLLTGGFVFYGGLIGAIFGIFLYCRKYKIGFWQITDTIIPSVPLIHSIGRLGCFCAGCCYGKEFPPPFGMLFDRSPYAPHNITMFPVQLLESILCMMIFIFILFFARKERRNGVVLGAYLVCYTVTRFILEYFRMDEIRGFLFSLSVSQWISILLLIAAVLLIIRPNYEQIKKRHI